MTSRALAISTNRPGYITAMRSEIFRRRADVVRDEHDRHPEFLLLPARA